MKHTPTVGTVLSMTPASGRVRFTDADAEEWTVPLIGWAVVVSWVGKGGYESEEYETDLAAVVLEGARYPMSLSEYMRDMEPRPRVTVELPS